MKYESTNIGLLIEQRMNELGINKSELARRIGIASQNVNRLLESKSLDVDKIKMISEALDYDFFAHYHPIEVSEADDNSITQSGDQSGASINGDVTINAASPSADCAKLEQRIADLEQILKEKDNLVAEKDHRISEKQQLIDEKERLIRILLSRQSS